MSLFFQRCTIEFKNKLKTNSVHLANHEVNKQDTDFLILYWKLKTKPKHTKNIKVVSSSALRLNVSIHNDIGSLTHDHALIFSEFSI